ncbi:MAG: type II toxin-antitoxin system mRNA interferase toxin, RelE/StbE family [Patescibacteria group bacterium]|jgi:addiction module RelE/StbE family toxin
MIVKNIEYSRKFVKQLKRLPGEIQKTAFAKEDLFKANPLHPSLRLHSLSGRLKGVWSISINKDYRIIFDRQPGGDILFISIGKHDIYNCL